MYTYIKLSKYVYISKCRNIWNSLPNINCLIESPRFLNPQQLSKTTAAQQKKNASFKVDTLPPQWGVVEGGSTVTSKKYHTLQ